MLIRYQTGLLMEAVLLSLAGGRMRVALKGDDDVAEYRLAGETWISEDGEPVTFDFSVAILAAVGIVPNAESTDEPMRIPAATTRQNYPQLSQSVN